MKTYQNKTPEIWIKLWQDLLLILEHQTLDIQPAAVDTWNILHHQGICSYREMSYTGDYEGIHTSEMCQLWKQSYTRTPVTTEAIKVPKIANVMIAPKFEKNGFWIQ